MTIIEKQLFVAAQDNEVEKVKQLLLAHPEVDINWENPGHFGRYTSLQVACAKGNFEVLPHLLARSDLDVNKRNSWEGTSLLLACLKGRKEAVVGMLQDWRVNVNLADYAGCTPLWWACQCDHLEIVKWLLASGRELDLERKGRFYGREMTPLEVARTNNKREMAELLSNFASDKVQTRLMVRLELKLHHVLAAELFALVVFLSDGYFVLSDEVVASSAGTRFFAMVRRLPMELQMVLCNRAYSLHKDIVTTKDSNPAFQRLAAWSAPK